MKKSISQILFAVSMVLLISGCSDNTSKSASKENPNLLSASEYFEQYEEDFVVEVFWLGCSHCQDVEPHLEQAKRDNPDIEVVRIPATFNERWNLDAAVYYTAVKEMGMEFKPLIEFYKQKRLEDEELPTVNELAVYVAENGKDGDEFKELLTSQKVEKQVRQADKVTRELDVSGTPTFFVNGETKVDTQQATGYKDLLNKVYSNIK